MMMQEVLTAILFACAAFYLGRQVYYSFSGSKKAGSCEKCGTAEAINKKTKNVD